MLFKVKIQRLEQAEKSRVEAALNQVNVLLSSAGQVPDPSQFFSLAQMHTDSLDLQKMLSADLNEGRGDNRQGFFGEVRVTHGAVNAFNVGSVSSTYNRK